MGNCVSSNIAPHNDTALPTAKVVLMDGSIKEFADLVRCHEIVREYPGHFICDSDGIYSGQIISQVLGDHDELQAGHLYFLLPRRKLEFLVTDSDVASMLGRANAAMKECSKNMRGKMGPLFDMHLCQDCDVNLWPCEEMAKASKRKAKLESIAECM